MAKERKAAIERTPVDPLEDGGKDADSSDIVARITRLVARGMGAIDEPMFSAAAREAFAFQCRHIPALRDLCRARGLDPASWRHWTEIPPIPAAAFAAVPLHAAPAREVFRSSGTTDDQRSIHHHPFPHLYRTVIDVSFPYHCLPAERREAPGTPMLSLIPDRRFAPDSSLAFMVDHVLDHFGAASSAYAFGEHGVEAADANAWCRARMDEGTAPMILATAFALAQWLEALEAKGETLSLPAGATIFETGGFKGRVRSIVRAELLRRIDRSLGVPPDRVVREYGMTELSSQLYSRNLRGGDGERLVPPPWARVQIVDHETLTALPAGHTGLIAVLDLANVGSVLHVLTEDLGRVSPEDPEAIELLGRADGATLRGCSLVVEALAFRTRE